MKRYLTNKVSLCHNPIMRHDRMTWQHWTYFTLTFQKEGKMKMVLKDIVQLPTILFTMKWTGVSFVLGSLNSKYSFKFIWKILNTRWNNNNSNVLTDSNVAYISHITPLTKFLIDVSNCWKDRFNKLCKRNPVVSLYLWHYAF